MANEALVFRAFRNTDPPRLRALWNLHAGASRGCAWLPGCDVLELLVFSKPYFQPQSLRTAWVGDRLAGFALAGLGPPGETPRRGAVCLLLVHPDFRGRGVGATLLKQAYEYLRAAGVADPEVGAFRPVNPYGFGLYGGSDVPGMLESDREITAFLRARHHPVRSVQVRHAELGKELPRLDDLRLPALRRSVRIMSETFPLATSDWHAATQGPVVAYRYEMVDAGTSKPIGSALAWDMELFTLTWRKRAFGVAELNIDPERRRVGYGKLLLHSICRHLQENKVAVVEAQAETTDLPWLGLLETVGFGLVDTGHVYRPNPTPPEAAAAPPAVAEVGDGPGAA